MAVEFMYDAKQVLRVAEEKRFPQHQGRIDGVHLYEILLDQPDTIGGYIFRDHMLRPEVSRQSQGKYPDNAGLPNLEPTVIEIDGKKYTIPLEIRNIWSRLGMVRHLLHNERLRIYGTTEKPRSGLPLRESIMAQTEALAKGRSRSHSTTVQATSFELLEATLVDTEIPHVLETVGSSKEILQQVIDAYRKQFAGRVGIR